MSLFNTINSTPDDEYRESERTNTFRVLYVVLIMKLAVDLVENFFALLR